MKKKLLIVVDYQNDFVSGSLGCPQAVAIEDELAAKIADLKELVAVYRGGIIKEKLE